MFAVLLKESKRVLHQGFWKCYATVLRFHGHKSCTVGFLQCFLERERAAEAPEETKKLVQKHIYEGDCGRKTTTCGAMQIGESSAGRVL